MSEFTLPHKPHTNTMTPTSPTKPRDPFSSARLIYRAVTDSPSDIALFAAINDDRIGHENSNGSNIKLPTPADAEKFRKSLQDDLLGAIICLAPDESNSDLGLQQLTPIGQIHLTGLGQRTQHHRRTEVGIDILPEWQGKGYGSEAIRWALDYAFRKAGLHKVRVRAFEWNVGAIKLYERIGFKHEGRERESLWHEGRFWDGIEMGMIDREWWELQKERRDESI